jgi:hypothetical protein
MYTKVKIMSEEVKRLVKTQALAIE